MTSAPARAGTGGSVGVARILVVEDNVTLRRGIVTALRERWGAIDAEAAGDAAIARLADGAVRPYDVVITDQRLPGADGVAVLRAARKRDPRTVVVLITAYASIETAVEAMRLGAFDFVQKPFTLEHLELRVARAIEYGRLQHEVSTLRAQQGDRCETQPLVGDSAALKAAVEVAERAAPSRSTVLITGETGTGKELMARLIHARSDRAAGPFVQVNCAALPQTLLESELFGHERGAFTGADRQRVGRFEQASGGTLFLDEVGDMSAATQAKLLRVLEHQEFHRLGGTRNLRTDARIVAATNQDLERAVAEGRFRNDLFFRVNVIGIDLPPLRERLEDIAALAQHFLEHFSRELGRQPAHFTRAALRRIQDHPWPGNIRELRNVIERAVLMSEGNEIDVGPMSLDAGGGARRRSGWCPEFPDEGVSLREVERRLVLEALHRTGHVQKDAAQLLGISRRKLNYMIRRMGLTHPTWRRNRAQCPDDAEAESAAATRASETP